MTGVFLMPQIEHDYPLILADLNARGYRVAVDTGWPPSGWTAELRQAASQWMQHCDILLLNETEVLHLAAKDNLEEALRELAAMLAPGGIAVAKTGSKGASAYSGGRICDAKAVRLNVIDTIGAGDSFNAGFLLALGAGAELTEALKTACRTASTIISKFPRQSIPPAGLAQILGTKRS